MHNTGRTKIEKQPATRWASKGARLALTGSCVALISACATVPVEETSVAAQPDMAARCAAMGDAAVGADAIALPSSGVSMESAEFVGDAATGYCALTGAVVSPDPADPPVRFRVNLPADWNGKAVQFGGGGFDGQLITAEGAITNAPEDSAPLGRGYVTFGSDGGHTGQSAFDGSFGMNAMARANYLGASVKRTHDAADALVAQFYGAAPNRVYFAGGSKGGHEALVAAQRYGADYDGVISYYPAQLLTPVWHRIWTAAYGEPGNALNPAQQALLKDAVMQSCDALDGLEDAIVSDMKACHAAFDVTTLQCREGDEGADSCLTEGQIAALRVAGEPVELGYDIPSGVTHMGPFPVFTGGDLAGFYLDANGTDGTKTAYYGFNSGVYRYFVMENPDATLDDFVEAEWKDEIEALFPLWEAKNPDIDTFRAGGGKLILVQGTTDMAVPPAETDHYFESLAARYGSDVDSFVRYYVMPGFGHGHGTYTMKWDALAALDRWVEGGVAPGQPAVIDMAEETAGRTRPLCRYPAYPRYDGAGDPRLAASFTCVAP